jgi:hypothetical protein
MVECVGQDAVRPHDDVGAGVQVDGDAGVNVFRVLTCHEEYCSAGVAEIMEGTWGRSALFRRGLKWRPRGLVALVVMAVIVGSSTSPGQ